MAEPERGAGSLTVVGAGIRPGLHTTREAIARIRGADKVLYLLAEVAPVRWLEELNPSAESLEDLYRAGRPYAEVYDEIVSTIMDHVRRGLDVCVVFYGHPGVFDRTSYDAVARARAEGFAARILPGITAEDCLYADLELDPGATGCQSFDATDFLVHRRRPDVTVPLILWQVGVIGGQRTTDEVSLSGLQVLAERLEELYGPEHEAIVYEATPFPAGRPLIERTEVADLADAGVTGLATLYVPPTATATADVELMARLGMPS
ncbi:MAG: SAM-dependent methyltransferase [Actinomycetota bacterium]